MAALLLGDHSRAGRTPSAAMSNDAANRRFYPPDIARDVDDELAFHVEMRARELESAGLSPDAPRA